MSDKDELRTKDASHVKEDSTRQAFYNWQESVSLLKAEARRRWMDKPRWGCTATAGRPANHVCRMWNQETEMATRDVPDQTWTCMLASIDVILHLTQVHVHTQTLLDASNPFVHGTTCFQREIQFTPRPG